MPRNKIYFGGCRLRPSGIEYLTCDQEVLVPCLPGGHDDFTIEQDTVHIALIV